MDDVEDSKPTDLESLKFNKLCRICGMENSQFMQIYGTEGRDHDIASKINQHFPMISVSEADQLPLQVCYQCASTLLLFHTLYDVCAKTDKQLRDMWRQATGCVDSDDEDPSFGNIDTLGPDSDDDVSDDGGGAKAKGSARSMRSVEKRQQRSFDLSTDGFSMSDDENTMDTSNALDPNVVIEEIGGDDDVLGGENSGLKQRKERKRKRTERKSAEVSKIFGQYCKTNKVGYTCSYCQKRIFKLDELVEHLNSFHYEKLAHKCTYCNLKFDEDQHMYYHVTCKHKGDGKPVFMANCTVCGMEFKREFYYKKHVAAHYGQYECDHCGQVLRSKDDLDKHTRELHAELYQFICNHCNGRFKTKRLMRTHIMNVHGMGQVCTVCGMSVRTPAHMKEHMMSHTGEKPLVCDICGGGFVRRTDFVRHRIRHLKGLSLTNDSSHDSQSNYVGLSELSQHAGSFLRGSIQDDNIPSHVRRYQNEERGSLERLRYASALRLEREDARAFESAFDTPHRRDNANL